MLLTIMLAELLVPLRALALTSGASQPEFQGFTPLATTSMVDPFSGDFSYNVPLLEIDGYPLNLVYRATSNIEEESSWVGYGWNVNIGTLNRLVRGLPDDMNGEQIKSYQNIKTRTVQSTGVSFEPSISFNVGVSEGIGMSAGVQGHLGFTKDDDNYTGKAVGVSVGGGVYAGVQAGPFSVGGSAGVTLSAHSSAGGTISTYAGFNAVLSQGDYFSIGFGKSVNRTFNTISGWAQPNVVGSLNISNISREIHRNFINSISNDIPQITVPYKYSSDGKSYRLNLGVEIGLLENVGLDMGIGITATKSLSSTVYNNINVHKGYGYMYSENATPADVLDFSRDNDGGINKDMPFMPPAMKTFDVFSSTAHGASKIFRADRNDFGTVRDPQVKFQNTALQNKTHELTIKGHMSLTCWLGISVKYDNIKTTTEGHVSSGGCLEDLIPYRKSNGKDQNLLFKVCGSPSMVDSAYINQINKYGFYRQNKVDTIKGESHKKRFVSAEPIAVYTNGDISTYPQTVIPKKLHSYRKNEFPSNKDTIVSEIDRADYSKIGAIMNTTSSGQTYVYATPVNNNTKNDVAFRISGFTAPGYNEREGMMSSGSNDDYASQFNTENRDNLYKNTITPSYATSYLLNAVVSPDYVDVENDGISDDDMGSYVKFNYTRTENDYRWRVPYGDKAQNTALLNQGVKVTNFDDMGSYTIGSKEMWYAHSIESKNHVVEFYLSDREDALDSRSKIMRADHPHKISGYDIDKDSFAHMQKLDSIKYYSKHDRFLNTDNAIPLKTIYFDYDYGVSSGLPNSVNNGGKLRLVKVRVRHGDEPIQFAETYDLGYSSFNPAYSLGDKDGWGNYTPNDRPIPLPEFPYIDQLNRDSKDSVAGAFHLNSIGLPSGGTIEIEYEADDYAYVQNKRAMALHEIAGVGATNNLVSTDVMGLYDDALNPYLYVYVKKPTDANISKSFLLNNTNLMYYSFNINIAGNAFSKFDQVKGYADVQEIGVCPNDPDFIYIKVKPVNLTGTDVKPSPMINTAINMARAYASDQLYFQEQEHSDGKNRNHAARLKKAANQVADAIFGKNSIAELMKDYRAGHKYIKGKSYVKLAMGMPKIGGGSRVSKITFDDEWNLMNSNESSSLIGYNYIYKDETGTLSSGVASYEPTLGGEENPLRSGYSYSLGNNKSKYPPYDPIELLKEDPVGESFFPTGSVGYSRVVIESIHKDYARSARSKLVHEFYTAKDFPYTAKFGPKSIREIQDEDFPNPGIRDILLSFLGYSKKLSSSLNSYDIQQEFVIETNDMHGKQKATRNYRLLQKNNKEELVSSTEYYYHTQGDSKLANDVSVIQYKGLDKSDLICFNNNEDSMPRPNIYVKEKTLGVSVDVCTDSREVVVNETRQMAKKGGGIKICLPPQIRPMFNWVENTHKHVDYFKSTTTTKIVNKYGIIKSVRTFNEGAESVVENKYYDGITGQPVVQVVKDEYGDNIYNTNIPAYWTKTDLEPSYLDYPFYDANNSVMPTTLTFNNVGSPYLPQGNNFVQAFFTTKEDVFHPGDEIFVHSAKNFTDYDWRRLYVVDVLVAKKHYSDPDPLTGRYGNGLPTGENTNPTIAYEYKVFVAPHVISSQPGATSQTIFVNDQLTDIKSVFKYRSGRKNMLDLSAGSFQAMEDPILYDSTDTLIVFDSECIVENLSKPVINASAKSYESLNSVLNGDLSNQPYNPVSTGVINQPYVNGVYDLFGDRAILKSQTSSYWQQRGNGVLYNWYYWLPSRYDSTGSFAYIPRKAMLSHYNNNFYKQVSKLRDNAFWFGKSQVTKSIPSIGPVEEKNALDIYSSIYVDPACKKVLHTTANGKYGQTWVETFEDMQQVRKYNGVTDITFSPFHKHMNRSSTLVTGYEVFEPNQSLSASELSGNFIIDKTQAHTGVYSLYVASQVIVRANPQKYNSLVAYSNGFDFNLNNLNNQDYTCEVWIKNTSGAISSPSVTSNGSTYTLTAVSKRIDGWTQYRAHIQVSASNLVTFTFPSGQYYDDLRVFPSTANVKTFVYHPFKAYLMAVLDENNYATFYEYNSRNQLTRLKKETEKGVLTITENIKNLIAK